MLQLIKEFSGPLIALVAGTVAFQTLNSFWRLLFFLTMAYLVTLLFSYLVTPPDKTNSNAWLYNIYILLEGAILTKIACSYFTHKGLQAFSVGLFLVFCGYFVFHVMRNGWLLFANYAFAAEAMMVIISFGLILYMEFQAGRASLMNPTILASFSLILYFACNIPYFAFYNWLKQFPAESRTLFGYINDLLAILRYVALAGAFVLIRRDSKKLAYD